MKTKISIYLSIIFPLFNQFLRGKLKKEKEWSIRRKILDYYKDKNINNEEIEEAINYIKKNGANVFPYSFVKKYNDFSKIKVYYDPESDLNYTYHNNHKLYFQKGMGISGVQFLYTALLREQDPESAHYYLHKSFCFNEEDTILDIGAAEGIFALTYIDKVKFIYLFEPNKDWIKPLQKTFEPWKNKVKIINKYVTNIDDKDHISIDSLINDIDSEHLFLKMDVEGFERSILNGAKKTLTSKNLNINASICTYHNQEDFLELSEIMANNGFNLSESKGYMLFTPDEKLEPPYFRKGMLYCSNYLNNFSD